MFQVSLTTSLLLFLGLVLPLRPLLLPWLAAHALLALCLVVASLNYLVTTCTHYKHQTSSTLLLNPIFTLPPS